jgi:hypothetical protein
VVRQIQARLGPAAFSVLLWLAPVPAVAAAFAHKHKHAPSPETLRARQVLLHRADLGSHWAMTPPAKGVPTLTCPAFSPNLSSLPKPGAAVSPTFSQTENGPFVSQTAYVYPKAAQALTFWHRVVTPRLSVCVAGSLTASSTQTVQFKLTRKRALKVPAIADRRAGYRVIGVATTTAQEITVYLDMIVVGRGTGLTQVSFTSFAQPPARSLELRLARLVAGRLPADNGGSKG